MDCNIEMCDLIIRDPALAWKRMMKEYMDGDTCIGDMLYEMGIEAIHDFYVALKSEIEEDRFQVTMEDQRYIYVSKGDGTTLLVKD